MSIRQANQTLQQKSMTAPAVGGFLRRKCACGNHTIAGGSACSDCGKKKSFRLLTKLKINEPGDEYEQEADRIANRVMSSPVRNRVGGVPAVKRFSKQSTRQMEAAPVSVNEALAGPGTQIETTLRHDMEQRFGCDLSRVRVHSGSAAKQSARELNACAYTVGRDIVCDSDRLSPTSSGGSHLLAHELTHVLQQEMAESPKNDSGSGIIQRFESWEHVRIGDLAIPGQDVVIVGYGRISYSEMIAMVGDYFESPVDIQSLARMGRFGVQQIDFVRWKVNPSLPKPIVDSGVEEAVDERYTRLASKNETHFSTGGAPGRSSREQYIKAHRAAIRAAYKEGLLMPGIIGLGWKAQEAGSNHFLTDAFSAGHIRTPRGEIQTHWNRLYPSFSENLVRTISCYMASYINDRDNVGYIVTVDYLASKIELFIRKMGGSALTSFSIGDLISKVMHDADNAGLDVVSPRGPAGTTTGSPFRWRAVGDNQLFPPSTNTAAEKTQQMVVEAVQLSFQEAQQAFFAGCSGDISMRTSLENSGNFRALALLPAEDAASTMNSTYEWRASTIDALPINLKSMINSAFVPGTEVRHRIDSLRVPSTYMVSGFLLHTGDAWNCFKNLLLADPFDMIMKICKGNVCPSGKRNPCPKIKA